ncbi:MAG: zinc-dependent alcohol dehydrogenase [Dictyoglomaceae bacterium]
MKNMGWLLKDIRKLELIETPYPIPKENEVLIEVIYAGICGSDLHAYQGEHPFVKPGIVLGHEFVGKIIGKGKKVNNFNEGDYVAIEPSLTCGKCYNCTHGRYNICRDLDVIGCTKTNGGFQKYIAIPSHKVYKIEEISLKRAVLTEPLAVGIHGVRRSSFKPGDEALVIGSGPIGLLTTIFLYLSSAKKIILVDPLEKRLHLAKRLCPNILAIKPEELNKDLFTQEGPDVVFECVGIDQTINMAIENARKGTDVILLGVPRELSTAELIYIQDREINFKGSLMYTKDDYLIAIDLLRRNQVNYEALITHIYPFDKLAEAFEDIINYKENYFKVIIEISSSI